MKIEFDDKEWRHDDHFKLTDYIIASQNSPIRSLFKIDKLGL